MKCLLLLFITTGIFASTPKFQYHDVAKVLKLHPKAHFLDCTKEVTILDIYPNDPECNGEHQYHAMPWACKKADKGRQFSYCEKDLEKING